MDCFLANRNTRTLRFCSISPRTAIVRSAVDIKKFVSHTSAIVKNKLQIAARLRSMDRSEEKVSSHLLVQKFSSQCNEKESLHLTYAYAYVMWVMSENFSEKVFWWLQNLNSAMNKKVFFKEKTFCCAETFYEKVWALAEKISAE